MSYPNFPVSSVGGSTKVLIPRLQKQRGEIPRKTTINRQNRVIRACLSCRSRKIKCNGLRPRCSNCSDNPSACVYASSRKDRLKTATLHNQDMVRLLRNLRHQVSSSGQDRIDSLLANVIEDVADATATVQQHPTDDYYEPTVEEERGDANASEGIGSSTDLDLLDEDIMRTEETRAADYFGKVSEIQQAHKLHNLNASVLSELGQAPWGLHRKDDEARKKHLAALHERQNTRSTLSMQTSKESSYLDHEASRRDLIIDPLDMPQFETADRLVRAYMESVHNSFPFLQKKAFLDCFYDFESAFLSAKAFRAVPDRFIDYTSLQRGNQRTLNRNWQAILNLVFAIGAVYDCLTTLDRCTDERDHLVYYSRAWSLTLKDPWWSSKPDIPHMQIAGLLSFYHLSIGHINRSWNLIGMAMRSGFASEIQVRNKGRNSGTAKKEIMSRIWWAHYALERLVSVLTGRPSLGFGDMCSIPLPLSCLSEDDEGSIIESRFGKKEEQSFICQRSATNSGTVNPPAQQDCSNCTISSGPDNSSSYLNSIVHLGEITQSALALYEVNTVSRSWESVQRTIANENEKLDAWASSLLEEFNFIHRPHVAVRRYTREQNTLEILYNTTKILITQPCLCQFDRRISGQTARSNDFNQRAALLCIGAAKSIADLLPDAVTDNIFELYHSGPWWQMVYVIMQALVVLLLEVLYESTCFPKDRIMVIPSLKKLLRWLRVMCINNGIAVRAYSISLALLKKLSLTIKIDITDIVNEDDLVTPAASRPPHSVPAHTRTPYPDILNPIHDSQTSAPSSEAQTCSRQKQQQQQQHAYDASQHSQYTQESSPYRNPPADATHFQPSYGPNSEPDSNAFNNILLAKSGLEGVMFPGWFVASFDEQNLSPDEGAAQDKDHIEEGSDHF